MHSYVSCLMHVVFSTKDRRRVITPAMQSKLWPHLGGIVRSIDASPLCRPLGAALPKNGD